MSMTKQEERQVIDAVLAGDTDRFETLVLTHQRGIYSFCLRMLGNEQDAADGAQETFFRAYRALRTFRGDSRFSLWLHRIAGSVCIDILRKRYPQSPVSLTDDDGEPLPIPDGSPSPQAELEARELRRIVRQRLLQLAPGFRQMLILRDVNGLSYDEIALVTGQKAGTVKSQIFRARKKLAALLLADGNFSELSSSFLSAEDHKKGGAGK